MWLLLSLSVVPHLGRADGDGFAAAPADLFRQRLRSASRVLNLLASMPASEPPVDLVARTLRRIERAEAQGVRASDLPFVNRPVDEATQVDRPLA